MFVVRKSEDPRYIAIASSTTMCDCSLKCYQDVDKQMMELYPDGVRGHILYDMLCSLGPGSNRFYDQTYNTKTTKRSTAVNGTGKPVTARKVGDQMIEAQLRFYAQDFSSMKSRSILSQNVINKMMDDFDILEGRTPTNRVIEQPVVTTTGRCKHNNGDLPNLFE